MSLKVVSMEVFAVVDVNEVAGRRRVASCVSKLLPVKLKNKPIKQLKHEFEYLLCKSTFCKLKYLTRICFKGPKISQRLSILGIGPRNYIILIMTCYISFSPH